MDKDSYIISAGEDCIYPDKASVSVELIRRNCYPYIGLGIFRMKNHEYNKYWLGPPLPYFIEAAWFCFDKTYTIISPFAFSAFNKYPTDNAQLLEVIFPGSIFYHIHTPYVLTEEGDNQIIKKLSINYSERLITNIVRASGQIPLHTFPVKLFDLHNKKELFMYAWISQTTNGNFFYPIFPEDYQKLRNYDFFSVEYEVITDGIYYKDRYWSFLPDIQEGHIFKELLKVCR